MVSLDCIQEKDEKRIAVDGAFYSRWRYMIASLVGMRYQSIIYIFMACTVVLWVATRDLVTESRNAVGTSVGGAISIPECMSTMLSCRV